MKNRIKLFIQKYSLILGLLLTLSACTQSNGALEKRPPKSLDHAAGEGAGVEDPVIKTTKTQIENAGEREISGSSFIRIRTADSDSFASLAEKYLGNSSKGWMIREFNQLDKIVSGQYIIIPKQSYTFGGLSSSGFQTVPVLRYMKFDKKFSIKVFVKQMEFLQTHGYQTISLEQFTKYLQFKTQIPSRSVVITIDNNSPFVFKSIYPLLKKFNYHAVLFLDPKQVGNGRNSLQWQQIKKMSENGVSIQCKPTSKRDWMQLDKKEQFSDYFDSMKTAYLQPKEILHQNHKKGCDYIAFPKGKSNLLTIKLIQKLGYLGGFSLAGWTNPFFVNPHGISRFSMSKDYSEKKFLRILRNFQPYTKGAKWKFGLPLPEEGIDNRLYYQQLGEQLREDMDYPRSLLSWQIAATFDPKNSAFKKTILETEQQKKTQTKTHYRRARKLHKKRRISKARIEYLKGLYHDPSHQKALYYVTNNMREREYTVYKIEAADTLKKIAKKEYNDEAKDFLIAFFNKVET
ncbi:MAG: polysaccharide deacetylase family protein, partial [Proteobacteria bacterium]|nr:polysaccharide deacetylase family protein [Pseudomonadota bacterium]